MINSFWNICSTCPMPKEEKLNSEYKRNYVWHPIYSAVPQDVVTIPPQALAKELGFQRKKQYPDLAYRTSKVISNEPQRSNVVDSSRTRSEERGIPTSPTAGQRSRSAEPIIGRQDQKMVMIQSYPPLTSDRTGLIPKMEELPILPEGAIKNTEYRSQFAWPQYCSRRICMARKSVSMGLIKAPDIPDSVPLKQKQDLTVTFQKTSGGKELYSAADKQLQDGKKISKTEYKAKYKPFTSYVYIDGQWKKTSRLLKIPENQKEGDNTQPWYSEVMERLQRANEYKCRGNGHPVYGEMLPTIYSKQSDVTPLVRPKKELPELHIPSATSSDIKKTLKKKDKHETKTTDKKTGKDKRRPESERSKSAEPRRERKSRPEHRPQTAPPPSKEKRKAPAPAHHTYSQKSATTKPTQAENRAKSMSRPPASRKSKEEAAPRAEGKESRTATHNPSLPPQSSAGKVWLQAGAPAHCPPSEGDSSLKGKHSDAVRPSTLLPPPQPSKSNTSQKNDELTENGQQPDLSALEEKLACVSNVSPVPVPLTHVQTPEEVTGVKSPEPENWTVPLDKGQKLQWTESSVVEPLLPQKPWAASEKIEKENISEAPGTTFSSTLPQDTTATSARITTADVLDRARSRLDQFWGKNK